MNNSEQLEPNIFVIFGGAGDLTWRKLMPALFDLSQSRSIRSTLRSSRWTACRSVRMPCGSACIWVSASSPARQEFGRQWAEFSKHIHYLQGEFRATPRTSSSPAFARAWKRNGHQSPAHFLYGHAAILVR